MYLSALRTNTNASTTTTSGNIPHNNHQRQHVIAFQPLPPAATNSTTVTDNTTSHRHHRQQQHTTPTTTTTHNICAGTCTAQVEARVTSSVAQHCEQLQTRPAWVASQGSFSLHLRLDPSRGQQALSMLPTTKHTRRGRRPSQEHGSCTMSTSCFTPGSTEAVPATAPPLMSRVQQRGTICTATFQPVDDVQIVPWETCQQTTTLRSSTRS
jgi:hypothetical protein